MAVVGGLCSSLDPSDVDGVFISMHFNKMYMMVEMGEEQVTISARIPRSQAEEVERLAARKGVDRSTVVRELVTLGIQEQRLKDALDLVRARKVTVWKAAEIAGVTYREMLQLLRAHHVTFPLSQEELRREIEEALGG